MRGRYADYAKHLYERPDVRIEVTDGRSFLRASPQQFDVVQMTLVDTWASTAAGAFAPCGAYVRVAGGALGGADWAAIN